MVMSKNLSRLKISYTVTSANGLSVHNIRPSKLETTLQADIGRIIETGRHYGMWKRLR